LCSVNIEEYNYLIKIFSRKIKETFTQEEMRKYFASNPRFGVSGYIMSEKDGRQNLSRGFPDLNIHNFFLFSIFQARIVK